MPRLWAQVLKTPTCWLWTGRVNHSGHGVMSVNGRKQYVHRLTWMDAHGPIPSDLQIDHLCRVPRCVRVEHLDLVTSRENTLRGDTLAARYARQTHCVHGHLFDAANTRIRRDTGTRECRMCQRLRNRTEASRTWRNAYDRMRRAQKRALV